jgi:hypothetical protein
MLTIVQLGVCGIISTVSVVVFETIPKQIGIQSIMSVLYLGLFRTMHGIII